MRTELCDMAAGDETLSRPTARLTHGSLSSVWIFSMPVVLLSSAARLTLITTATSGKSHLLLKTWLIWSNVSFSRHSPENASQLCVFTTSFISIEVAPFFHILIKLDFCHFSSSRHSRQRHTKSNYMGHCLADKCFELACEYALCANLPHQPILI